MRRVSPELSVGSEPVTSEQADLCARFSVHPVASHPAGRVGISRSVRYGQIPSTDSDTRSTGVRSSCSDSTATISESPIQNAAAQRQVLTAQTQRASDIRVNQQQVNAAGQRVAINRPDLQYTLNGTRHYWEYDTVASDRAAALAGRLYANDPLGVVHLITQE